MKDCVKHSNHVGIFLAILFTLSFFLYWLRPVNQELHLQLLQLHFFGFTDMDLKSFIFGFVQSYIWGYIIVAIWCISGHCCGGCCKRD